MWGPVDSVSKSGEWWDTQRTAHPSGQLRLWESVTTLSRLVLRAWGKKREGDNNSVEPFRQSYIHNCVLLCGKALNYLPSDTNRNRVPLNSDTGQTAFLAEIRGQNMKVPTHINTEQNLKFCGELHPRHLHAFMAQCLSWLRTSPIDSSIKTGLLDTNTYFVRVITPEKFYMHII